MHYVEVSGQLNAPAALHTGKQNLVPIVWGWVGPRAGLYVKGKAIPVTGREDP
jgi:hypothetical protein